MYGLLCSQLVPPSTWKPLTSFLFGGQNFPEGHTSGIKQHVTFHVWLLSLHLMPFGFVHLVAYVGGSFLFIAELCSLVWTSHCCSPVEGHLSFQTLVTMNRTTINICVHELV